ncbi:MAG: endonuclease domain-containing protein [Alphaproteobacteria bacterium]|nr:endonuclease domain-containing protein [Alphaproteobacteria bacterium]
MNTAQENNKVSLPPAGRVREGGGEATTTKMQKRINKHENTPDDHKFARNLRNAASPFEQKLWVALREQAKQKNLKFRRQQPLHPFIADFACMQARLVVELDGDSHDTRLAYDKMREEKLKQMGFTILRFQNKDVVESLDYVVEKIMRCTVKLIAQKNEQVVASPPPSLTLPARGKGILSTGTEAS